MSDDERENFVFEEIPKDNKNEENVRKKKSREKEQKKLTFYETIKKGPLEKYLNYGIFPWKFIICILLVIFTICQVVLIVQHITTFNRAQVRGLYNLFIDDSDKLDPDYNRVVYLYSLDDLREHMRYSLNNYYNVRNLTLDDVDYLEGNPSPVIEFRYLNNKVKTIDKDFDLSGVNPPNEADTKEVRGFYYTINQTSLGPFEGSDEMVKEFINDVVDFKINYTLVTRFPYLVEGNFECNQWSVVQTYSFESRAHFICQLNIQDQICSTSQQIHNISWFYNFVDRLLWIHIIVLTLAIASLYFTMCSMHTFVTMYMKSKNSQKRKKEAASPREEVKFSRHHFSSESSEDSIYFNPLFDTSSTSDSCETEIEEERELSPIRRPQPFNNGSQRKESLFAQEHKQEKKKKLAPKKHFLFLQFWSTFIIMGNFLQILGACLALSNPTEVTTIVSILIGSGCLFACISTGKYIEYQSDYATIYETLKRSFPVVIRYLIGVFPIFLGFLFFGICVFWKSERFNSTSRASMCLFAMIQGDIIFDTFTDLSTVSFFIGQIYCYLFCIIFIIIVWNIFISIIEEAYVVTKVKNKTSWIYSYLDLEPKLVDMKLHSKPSLEMTKKYFEKMDKSSELLKRRISRSLRSNEVLAGKNRESSSFDERPFSKSINKNRDQAGGLGLSYKEGRESKEKRGRKLMSVKGIRSYYGPDMIAESIPENEEFDYRFREPNEVPTRRKYTFEGVTDDKEKLIDGYFTKIENRIDNIKNFSGDLLKLMAKRRNYLDYSSKKEIKEDLNNKINSVELKAKELRQVWMRNY